MGHNSCKNAFRVMSLDFIFSPFYSETIFLVSSIYVQKRQRYDKTSQFLQADDNDDEEKDYAKAIAIPRVCSKNSRTKNWRIRQNTFSRMIVEYEL